MAIVYLTVNGTNNAISQASYQAPYSILAQDYFLATVDDSVVGVKDLLSNPSAHTYDVIMGSSEHLTAYYTGSNLIINLVNPPTTPPTSVTFSLCGTAYTATFTNNQAQVPITVHPSVTYANIPIAVILNGISPITVQIGGNSNGQAVNAYLDANNVYQIAPVDETYLASYYTSGAFNQAYVPVDTATWLGILTDLIVTYIIPNMQQATYTPLSITGDAGLSLTDIKTNLLPSILTTLAAAAPSTGIKDPHWNSVVGHSSLSKQAAVNFITAASQIPWMK